MGIVPEQAILETEHQRVVISAEDTIWLYRCLTGLDWENGLYVECVPTHTLILWNGEYRFSFPADDLHDHINYVCGDSYMCTEPVESLLMQRIYACFAAYIP